MLTFQNVYIQALSLGVILFKYTSNYKLRDSRFIRVSFVFPQFKTMRLKMKMPREFEYLEVINS